MNVRHARIPDARAICDLVNYYAERGRMLHRSLESIFESIREFLVVADDEGKVVGCAAIDVVWSDLAEVKSVAVSPDARGQGVGKLLMRAVMEDARRIGVRRLFALTLEDSFFLKCGFEVIDRATLPEKVWRECLACPKADACDEIAMLRRLDLPEPIEDESDADADHVGAPGREPQNVSARGGGQ